MGLFDRVEQRLERAVNGAFARAFKAEVQPVEIASAIRRAMDDRAAVVGVGRTIVPNLYTVELSETDHARLTSYADALTEELVASAQEHAESQRYRPGGPIRVHLTAAEELETGVFRLRPSTGKAGPDVAWAASHQQQPAAFPPAAAPPPAAPAPPPQAAAAAQTPPAAPARPAAPAPRPYAYADADARPWLDIDGERYPLLGALTVLGRDDTADIVLDDPGISRRHSEIRVTNDGPHLVTTIRDLGSTNGTFVNGERVGSHHLATGDRVTVGRTSVTFRAGRR